MAEFASVDAWADLQERRLNKALRVISVAVFNKVVLKTRWKTGRLRANWLPSYGAPLSYFTRDEDPSGSATMAKIQSEIMGNTEADTFYLSNNLIYAPVWNEVDGYIDLARAYFKQIAPSVGQKV